MLIAIYLFIHFVYSYYLLNLSHESYLSHLLYPTHLSHLPHCNDLVLDLVRHGNCAQHFSFMI